MKSVIIIFLIAFVASVLTDGTWIVYESENCAAGTEASWQYWLDHPALEMQVEGCQAIDKTGYSINYTQNSGPLDLSQFTAGSGWNIFVEGRYSDCSGLASANVVKTGVCIPFSMKNSAGEDYSFSYIFSSCVSGGAANFSFSDGYVCNNVGQNIDLVDETCGENYFIHYCDGFPASPFPVADTPESSPIADTPKSSPVPQAGPMSTNPTDAPVKSSTANIINGGGFILFFSILLL